MYSAAASRVNMSYSNADCNCTLLTLANHTSQPLAVRMAYTRFPSIATLWSPTQETSSGYPRPSTSPPAPLRCRTFLSTSRTALWSSAPGPTTTPKWISSSRATLPAVMTSRQAESGTLSPSRRAKTRTPMTSPTLISPMILWCSGSRCFTPLTWSSHACWSHRWPSWCSTCHQIVARRWRCASQCCWRSLCSCCWYPRLCHPPLLQCHS